MKPIECDAVRDVLPDYVQGRTVTLGRVGVARHLAGCTACAAERHVVALIAKHGAEPDERLLERVLRVTKPRPRARRFVPQLAVAASVALALLGGSLLLRQAVGPPLPSGAAGEPTVALVEAAVGQGALSWLDNDPLLRAGVGLDDLSLEELELLLMELES